MDGEPNKSEGGKLSFPEFSLYKLLSLSKTSHHANVRMLWADPEIHYLVLFEDAHSERAVLSVGPGLEYESLEELDGVSIDGMEPVGYVRCRNCPKRKKGQTRGVLAENTKAEPRPEAATGSTANIPSDELARREAELKAKEDDLTNLKEELLAREAFLSESEARLQQLANDHVEREEMLNYKEELLQTRATKLNKLEESLKRREERLQALEKEEAKPEAWGQ